MNALDRTLNFLRELSEESYWLFIEKLEDELQGRDLERQMDEAKARHFAKKGLSSKSGTKIS